MRTRMKESSSVLLAPKKAAIIILLNSDDDPSWISLCGFWKSAFNSIYENFCVVFARMWRAGREPLVARDALPASGLGGCPAFLAYFLMVIIAVFSCW